MNVAAPSLLIAYAVLVGVWGPRFLARCRSLDRSPVASILVWQTVSVSVLMSIVLAGTAVAVPAIPATTSLADLLSACADALRDHYATPGGVITSLMGALIAAAIATWAIWSVGRQVWTANRHSCRQRLAARLVGRRDHVSGSLIVESPEPAVYCVPGRQRTVVLTSAALSHLNPLQVAAVLAHEDVHLKYKHHLVLSVARGLHRGFPFVPLFRAAYVELERLVEVHADDDAAKRHDRRTLATALVSLAEARSPAGSLGAGGTSTVRRVYRLVDPPSPMGPTRRLALALTVTVLVAIPFVLVAMPAIGAIAVHYCPVEWAT